VFGTVATPVIAAEAPSPGAAALRQARAAWDKGSLKSAEPLYREALEKGGLAPSEVLEGYVRLGAIRAAAGKKQQAIAAFRAAAILDASFAVPAEAGRRGPALAAQARKDTAKIGSIKLKLEAPKDADAGKPFKVTVKLDAAHVPIVAKIGLVAKEGTSAKEALLEAKADESVDLDVPSDLAVANASVLVRVDALDAHQNRLASVEEQVKVGDAPAGPTPVVVAPTPTPPSKGSGFTPTSADPAPPPDRDARKGRGFWASPWPYVIGGVALAGAGAAVYFGTRPSQDVSVGQVGVRTR
jgi:hypothetical protein